MLDLTPISFIEVLQIIYKNTYLFGCIRSYFAALSFFSCDRWTLSCGMRHLVPWPGIEPRLPALGAWSLIHWTTRVVPTNDFLIISPLSYIHQCIFPCIYWSILSLMHFKISIIASIPALQLNISACIVLLRVQYLFMVLPTVKLTYNEM